MRIQDVPWPEVREALKRTDLLIVPLGATETYGPHLPTGVEIYVTEEVAKRLGERANALVTPILPVTCSRVNTGFPGTLYITLGTLAAMLRELCSEMVLYGIKRIFFLNGHGPNVGAIDEISRELATQGVKCVQVDMWRAMIRLAGDMFEGRNPTGHASELATSMLLVVRPDLVQTSKYVEGHQIASLAQRYPDVTFHACASERTEHGHFGDPRHATPEKGAEMLRRTVDRFAEFLGEWK